MNTWPLVAAAGIATAQEDGGVAQLKWSIGITAPLLSLSALNAKRHRKNMLAAIRTFDSYQRELDKIARAEQEQRAYYRAEKERRAQPIVKRI